MSHICPKPCSLLATAAVFISVGVIQFVVGIILLRSRYVYLLAGPDFWTSGCNIAVGCLLGVSASVWKQSKKHLSEKQMIRRNLLSSLLFSALIVNATTLGLLLLGEGNTLLSIQLESGGKNNELTFISEVLAYAYATSVCSPIVCIVVTIVSLAGNCFTAAASRRLLDMSASGVGKRKNSLPFNWIFTPDIMPKTRNRRRISTSSSSSDDEADESIFSQAEYSAKDLQHVLSKMALGKRDNKDDSNTEMHQMDQHRKKYNSLVEDGSYLGPILSRENESNSKERNLPKSDSVSNEKSREKHPRSGSHLTSDSKTSLISEEVLQERINYIKNKSKNNASNRKWHSSNDLVDGYKTSPPPSVNTFKPRLKHSRDKHQLESEIDSATHNSNFPTKSVAEVHGHADRPKLDVDQLSREEIIALKQKFDSVMDNEVASENRNLKNNESAAIAKSPEPVSLNSESDANSYNLVRTSSWVGEVVPINVSSLASKLSQKLIPVPSPIAPISGSDSSKSSDSVGSKSESTEDHTEKFQKSRESNMSTFREDVKLKSDKTVEYPKTGSPAAKKYDLGRMVTMTSISEEPNSEETPSTSDASRDASSQEGQESPKIPPKICVKKSLSQAYSAMIYDALRQNDSPGKNKTPKRKSHLSSTRSLRRIWSAADTENRVDILKHVVDEDSLIGLSEKELMERQSRTRSLRKAVQQRIKQEEMNI